MSLLAPSDYYTLLEIFLFLAVAQLIHSVTSKVGFPEIVADLLAGMVIGSYALGGLFDQISGAHLFAINTGVLLFADFSVVLVLFSAGLGGGFMSLRRAGLPALGAAVVGDLLSFGVTFAVFSRFYSIDAALFVAVAVAATSSAVAVSLAQSLAVANTPGGQFLVNASALDDVVALLLLSIVLAILTGTTGALQLTGSVATSILAWIILLLAAVVLIPRLLRSRVLRKVEMAPFMMLFIVIAVVLALGFSPVIGAFIAGLAVAESIAAPRTRELTAVLVAVFGALFFIVVGAEFDVALLFQPGLLALALVLTALAATGKVLGVFPFARLRLSTEGAWAVAFGMIPRGEIGLLVGAVGYSLGVIDDQTLGEIVVMAIATTLIGSILFPRFASSLQDPYRRSPPEGTPPNRKT